MNFLRIGSFIPETTQDTGKMRNKSNSFKIKL